MIYAQFMDTLRLSQEVPQATVSLLPLHIQYSGPANTKEYFSNTKSTEKVGKEEREIAYFRGCRLVGHKTNWNGKYRGYILNKSETIAHANPADTEGIANGTAEIKNVKVYNPIAKFDEMTIYGHDNVIELTSQWRMVSEWSEISDAIHS